MVRAAREVRLAACWRAGVQALRHADWPHTSFIQASYELASLRHNSRLFFQLLGSGPSRRISRYRAESSAASCSGGGHFKPRVLSAVIVEAAGAASQTEAKHMI